MGATTSFNAPCLSAEPDSPAPPCAEVRSRRAPESWPPAPAETHATNAPVTAADATAAIPFTPGNANYVKVKIKASRVRRLHVCIVPTDYLTHRLGRYTERTKTSK